MLCFTEILLRFIPFITLHSCFFQCFTLKFYLQHSCQKNLHTAALNLTITVKSKLENVCLNYIPNLDSRISTRDWYFLRNNMSLVFVTIAWIGSNSQSYLNFSFN